MTIQEAAERIEKTLPWLAKDVARHHGEGTRLSELIVKAEAEYDWDFKMFYMANKPFYWEIPETSVKACWLTIRLDGAAPTPSGVEQLLKLVA